MQIQFPGIVLGMLLLPAVWAGDAAQLNFIGFSADGKYLAFEQYGVTDGSAAPYSELHLINVADNHYLSKPLQADNIEKFSPDELSEIPLDSLRKLNLSDNEKAINKYKLDKPQTGLHLIHHPLHDLGANPDEVTFSPQIPLGGRVFIRYQLSLTEEEDSSADCFDMGTAKRMTLKLINLDLQESQEQAKKDDKEPVSKQNPVTILQQDKKLPKARGCVLDYRIQDVYLYDDKHLAVLINQFKPGFEGQDMRYMVVTGKLP